MAMAENQGGGVPSCNRFQYRFDQVALAGTPGGAWVPFRHAQADVLEDPGARLVPLATNGFLAGTGGRPANTQAAPHLLRSE
jgi:hypothetical protein